MLSEYRQALRLFSRNARSYVIFNLFVGLYYNGLFLVLLNLFLLRLGYGLDRIGLINALGWASVLVCSVPAGMCGTRWGTRQALVAGSILYTLGVGLCPLAMFAPLHLRTAWLLATNVLAGAGGALFLVNGNPFLMDATSPRERNHAFSLVMALGPFAAFAGGLIGGLLPGLWATALRVTLDEPAPYGYSLLAGTALLLPGIAVLLGTHDLRAQAKPAAGLATASAAAPEVSLHSGGQAAPYGLIGVMMLVGLLRVAGESAARTFFNVHLDASLGASTALIGVLGAVAQLGSGVAPLAAPLLWHAGAPCAPRFGGLWGYR
jgi:MFS family permease